MDQISEELGLVPLDSGTSFDERVMVIHHEEPDDNVEDDFIRTRETLNTLLENGAKMVPELARLAKQTESARMFEVLSTYMNTLNTIAMNNIDIHKKRKDALMKQELKEPQVEKKFAYIGAIEDIQYD